ncbi:hypothetical protein FOXG_11690 [Fusarium oxysporum f. sp. lycopersici 4287]|uniref:Protein kinase domain-containing protein n=3 Tax=Fusarium oxysporum TaxID=5507 RepID=A0A0J9VLT4_FUSO4|nr:hypothetical protein FOXG_11690 [Fusarium oxysporum f. sp. lycopersici 4287]EXK29798.1 hypothetical protein FOMG_14227 [Fusarium oxysporum f. sp. melonis 26406]KAJ9418757.1 hypothetical protein QL093DRAFT_2591855 [Fusarium oxysporum]KNB12003.1 hypothetical protein FOXG_11690 [Fusarium oxysporum f. sp. lycopersici 4287]
MSNAITKQGNIVPKSNIEILNQEIDDDEGLYRIRAGNRVHYVTIPGYASPNRIFDEDKLCRPYLLVPELPPFPDTDWTKMRLSLGPDGSVQSDISFEPLDKVESTWHPRHINVLSLKRIKYHKQRVREVEYQDKTAISKIAVLQWLVPQLEHETRTYEALTRLQSPDEVRITPEVLGHLFEGGRNIGLLLEKIEGDYATLADLPKCEAALRKLHQLGFVHGDANRYNFIVERSTGNVKMIDFEHAEQYDEKAGKAEIQKLASELTDDSGRGAPVTFNYR